MGLGRCGQGPAFPRSHKWIVSCLHYNNGKDHYKSRGFCFCVTPLHLGGYAISAPSLGTEEAVSVPSAQPFKESGSILLSHQVLLFSSLVCRIFPAKDIYKKCSSNFPNSKTFPYFLLSFISRINSNFQKQVNKRHCLGATSTFGFGIQIQWTPKPSLF